MEFLLLALAFIVLIMSYSVLGTLIVKISNRYYSAGYKQRQTGTQNFKFIEL